MVWVLRQLNFWAKSKLFHRIIVYNPNKSRKILSAQSRQRGSPLFFLFDRKINYVPKLSITHHLAFSRLKILDYLSMASDEQEKVESCRGDILDPPHHVRGMRELDRSKFEKVIRIPCVRAPVSQIQGFRDVISRFQLRMPNISPIADLDSSDPNFSQYKLILLNPLTASEEFLSRYRFEDRQASLEEHEIKLTYSNWDFNAVVNAILPEDVKVSGFSQVGHIAHFNLRDEVLPYKHIIGEVLLDKLRSIKTVVNKLDTIDNTYRNFKMELLAGENNFITHTRENGCTFELDFSKVYWNSRLGSEHGRIVKIIKEGDLVFDVFAGIGPFAVPAAKKKAVVFANDLNPASYESLLNNIQLNKVKSPVHSYNMDGREFIQTVVKDELLKFYSARDESVFAVPPKVHIVMNLPALAVTFLDAFKSLFASATETDFSGVENLPTVHCYCFTNLQDSQANWDGDKSREVKQRVIGVIGSLTEDDVTLRFVRDVAPNKEMMCATFQLTQEILCGKTSTDTEMTPQEQEENGEPPRKILKTADDMPTAS